MAKTSGIILKTIAPVVIGLAVVAWLFAREFSIEAFRSIPLDGNAAGAVALAVMCVVVRQCGLTWRFRLLTLEKLTWWKCLRVSLLCDFTSAITPGTAGGSALSMVFLKSEGMPLGRGTAIMLITMLLDNAFFVVACPLIFLFIPGGEIFAFSGAGAFQMGVRTAFWIVYGGICAVSLFLVFGIFVNPGIIGGMVRWVFRLRWLRRWRDGAEKFTSDMALTGTTLRHRPASWWGLAFLATALTWTARFCVVNSLFLAFSYAALQTIVFARQFVVWTLLFISPTPGGSGLSEWLFTNYYGDLLGGDRSVALVLAVCWRLLTYYLFLIIGAFIVPSWIRKSISRSGPSETSSESSSHIEQ